MSPTAGTSPPPPLLTSHSTPTHPRSHAARGTELYLHFLPTPRDPRNPSHPLPLRPHSEQLLDTLTILAAPFRRPWWLQRSGGIAGRGGGGSSSSSSHSHSIGLSFRSIATSAPTRAVTMISSIRVIHPPAASSNPTPHPLVVLTVGTNKYVFNAPEGTVRTLTQRRAPLGGKGELNVFVSDVCEATRGLPGAYADV